MDLDIGGVSKISTVRSTLTKYSNSALSLMFSGRFKLPTIRGRIFIDRNGLAFSHVVNYLRTGKFPLFNDRVEEASFFNELDFWKIPIYEITNPINKILEFDPDWCASPLSLEGNNTIVKKHSK